MNIREAIERSWRRDERVPISVPHRVWCAKFKCASRITTQDFCKKHLRRWQFRRNIVRFVPRFIKAIIAQKQGEKQQITEYNWENKVYESGVWMNSK